MPLYQTPLWNPKFHERILDLDRDQAETCRAAGCPDCGGRLHVANYQRKPRGWLIELGEEHNLRFSFCCAVDGCRARATPSSLRFLGRKVYLTVIVTLAAAMREGLTDRRLKTLGGAIAVDRRTVARWRSWWLSTFPAMPLWRARSAAFMPPADVVAFPASLLSRFAGIAAERLEAWLGFLGPMTGGASMQAF